MSGSMWIVVGVLAAIFVGLWLYERRSAAGPYEIEKAAEKDTLLAAKMEGGEGSPWLSLILPCGSNDDLSGVSHVQVGRELSKYTLRVDDKVTELTAHQLDVLIAILAEARRKQRT